MKKNKVNFSEHVYIIHAMRNTSQFNQNKQVMRCRVIEAYSNYLLVESLKRYNRKYKGANVVCSGKFKGMPVRRINKEQIELILDEKNNKVLKYSTVCRREGTLNFPGRSRL